MTGYYLPNVHFFLHCENWNFYSKFYAAIKDKWTAGILTSLREKNTQRVIIYFIFNSILMIHLAFNFDEKDSRVID